MKYEFRFWFEHGGFCVWGMNAAAKEKYGYAIRNENLPISAELRDTLDALEVHYGGCLDWAVPQNPSPWTQEEREQFRANARKAHVRLQEELGADYLITDEIDECIYE